MSSLSVFVEGLFLAAIWFVVCFFIAPVLFVSGAVLLQALAVSSILSLFLGTYFWVRSLI